MPDATGDVTTDAAADGRADAEGDVVVDAPLEDAPSADAPSADAPANDAPAEDAPSHSCTCKDCVCASSGPSCAQSYASSDCFQGNCCVLAPDAGPPYYDDAGTCPGMCSSPDDIGCPHWFRSSACAGGDLCCVLGAVDGGSD